LLNELLVFIFGLLIGSFLNVCIYRLPQLQSIITPPSHCMTCSTRLRPWELIPVLSYLLSRGRCRYCGTTFSSRYAMVEVLTAGMFVWCLEQFGVCFELIGALVLTAFLLVITFIDYDHQLILNKVLLWMSGAGIVINGCIGNVAGKDMLIASLLGGGLLLLIVIVSRGGMGDGDVKFAAALGLWLGWQSLLLTLFLSFVIGGFGGGLLLLLKIKGRKDMIPFGPFIALGAFIALLYGNQIITWYIGRL
jgi:leader peptidase (prepilin peptidase)/N-methyltransferase